MDIMKSNNNFKDGKPKYFNYNEYRHIVKECQSKKKEDKWQCFKCDKEEHIAVVATTRHNIQWSH